MVRATREYLHLIKKLEFFNPV